ncbi:MAG: hypothetical protein B6I20_00565 [Bacteroidetes bacterium 4572_117]|nr:MAG: hypothetical protein B6I20_00565 [Bacteroidetes bacterium 4572_117]
MANNNQKGTNSIGWTIFGIVGGTAILASSAIMGLIKKKNINSKTFLEFYKKKSYSVRLHAFRFFVSQQKNNKQFNETERSLIEIAELMGIELKDYESVIAMNNPSLKAAYKILQINENVSVDELKSSFRRLSKLYHPDKVEHLGDEFKEEARRNFQNILDAYKLIKKTHK